SDVCFIGLPWLNTWGSGRFMDVGKDAKYIVDHIKNNTKFLKKKDVEPSLENCP
ncbi:FAD-dependent oxidoreductase, partial [Acinetobacter baumannii]|nr:FAD-dependent oxidoreductase [Acinetobacter baumannii]MDC4714364.1 FAD-dependent oxidoreductase [Acinetobacter baumannii]